MEHVEILEDHEPVPARGRPTAAIAAITLAIILLAVWHYFRPSHALAGGEWMTDWDQAVEKSQASGKPALVLFTADWCPACRQFESSTLSDSAVRKHLSDNFTLVVIDLTKQEGPNLERARECGVTGIPTIIRYGRDGREIARSHGMSSNELLNWLR
jgi:thiol:disulfide interchange protein DsbD